MAGGRGASRATANHKSTGSNMPSRAEDVLVGDVRPPAKLLLQQRRTCLHIRVLLHGRR